MPSRLALPSRIEDYAIIGDKQTAALVSRCGSIDWLCLPRFDSGACFAALIGTSRNGRWLLAPVQAPRKIERAYREDTLVLDTTFHLDEGSVMVTDCMPVRDGPPRLVRLVRGLRGRVKMATELVVRFDYGSIVPWVRKDDDGLVAIAGPDSLHIRSEMPLRGEGLTTVGELDVSEGQTVALSLTWQPSHVPTRHVVDPRIRIAETEQRWRAWTAQCTYRGEWNDAVRRSLVTLSALTHASTGGQVAAPTTSLPEAPGGQRNWDYRYCWLRDATFTLFAMVHNGFREEARAWREWLLRAVAGDPSKLQILYGVDGERRIGESEIPWLPGYGGARPVRVGNAAHQQRQLDVYGEVLDSTYQCHRVGMKPNADGWDLMTKLLEFLESSWEEPDDGIWEVRGPQRQFTHSKVMAWLAFDRGIRLIEELGVPGPRDRWRAVREKVHAEVCQRGYDEELGSFVQYYGSKHLDASLLMVPLIGFLPPTDARVRGTVRAVEERLMDRGLVRRYESDPKVDGLPRGEGVFLPCSFWLVDNLALMGRKDDARRLFERLLGLRNDVGLLAEEYDVRSGRQLGNFPQAFSHVSLVNTAQNLSQPGGPAHRRSMR
ncbi:MAG TPA: glycoside hydrolase family 15 protein [Polyangiaceae bacterium]|jgi:GH15 family glucan-1,4-alpha-glucosidase